MGQGVPSIAPGGPPWLRHGHGQIDGTGWEARAAGLRRIAVGLPVPAAMRRRAAGR
ncbi:MAG: hypothetical protein HY870_12095 [Chloroflexi bacterium]|nr:hypothetical protein [Chloroflexota bacterium]